LARPLYEATKQGEQETSIWGREQEKAFKEIKKALTNASALGLPDVMKTFFLYVHEQKGDNYWGPDSTTRLLAPSSGLLGKTI
jgi:hypothetical protein